MFIVFIGVISILCIVFFAVDCAGRLNRKAAGTGIIYLLFPAAAGTVLCVSALSMQGVPEVFYVLSNAVDKTEILMSKNADISDAFSFVIECIAAVPAFILPIVGVIRVALSDGNNTVSSGENDLMGALWYISVTSSVIGTLSSVELVLFVCLLIFISLGSVTMELMELFAVTIVFGMLTLGIGFMIMAFVIPIYIIVLGAYTVVMCLPLAACAAAAGMVFTVMQIVTVFVSAVQMRRIYKENRISKKKAVLYALLSALPLANIFISFYIRPKILNA